MTDKRLLRAELRAARDAFVAEHSGAIAPPAPYLALLRPGLTIASYVPIGSEADPALLVAAAIDSGCALALPHVVSREQPLRFLEWHPTHPLDDGPFGLRQPQAMRRETVPDIILTPLVGFDAILNRLGQGAGHYDRAFAAHPEAQRIGVAWSVQHVAALTPDPWDVPLHAIITESGWIERDNE
ncbi:5-formyltetrahydrofolate cyclo-ligase [Hephaestia sp. GCM10023244]|uniref:5-formyltetrahydrofolate cyclo-ligase n=1 Tax=unclassified Hephaestia TaxID=2631281 RepID=UPI00207744D8|nr:5-formyltetrahydrofolate cyclo-ligase [Hephaestia sp. MAHUQ-44]MCM8730199.1 5-formyltetrahydrofolate cyclo-ligase [Hephaestia sp. MAHUQ-44]